MLIYEFRVILPMTVQEYQVAQLFSVAELSMKETGGGDGVEVLVNEPFSDSPPLFDSKYTKGQYTHKIYHMTSKCPRFVTLVAPTGSLTFHEKAWNAYPYCRTVLKNNYMDTNFESKIESLHIDTDLNLENAHKLPPDQLAQRKVVYIDITDNSIINSADYVKDEDPNEFTSSRKDFVPLKGPKWWENDYNGPVMCAYKLMTCYFQWWGLSSRVEQMLVNQTQRLFTKFHRQVYCWQDRWKGMSMSDIRAYEEEVKQRLADARQNAPLQGTSVVES